MFNNDLEVLWVARYDYQPGWNLKQHTHNYYQTIYILGGKGDVYLNGHNYPLSSDMLFFIKPGDIHGLNAGSESTVKTLDIKFNIYPELLIKQLNQVESIISLNNITINNLFEEIRNEGKEMPYYYKEFCNHYLYEILLILLRLQKENDFKSTIEMRQNRNNGQDALSEKLVEYIKNNYSKQLTLNVIAAALGYNKNYLCTSLKKTHNITPMRYLFLYRIQKAKELIKYSDYSLKEISVLIGFESIHHFSRLFKGYEGIPPGRWRDKEREGIQKDIYLCDSFINEI